MALEEDIQQKHFKNEKQKVFVNILYTNNDLVTKTTILFKKFDLTRQQYNVLRILRGQHPKSAPINLIKERMLDKMSDASRIVERLRLKELIERSNSKTDRRAAEIGISPKGLSLLKEVDPLLEDFENNNINLSTEEAAILNKLLDKSRS